MMIDSTYIYEVKSIGLSERKGRKPQTLSVAARHNLREIQAENGADAGKIDPGRMHLNEVLIGPSSACEVVHKANKLFEEAGIDQSKQRKDYNQASEHVFSLRSGQEERGFFQVMADCAIRIFGAENVLSFVVHRDQDNPHAHMLVSPISDGKYLGSKLHMREPLARLKAEFAKSAETIGFQPVPAKKIRRQKISEMVAKIVAYLEYSRDPLLFHPQWQVILQMITKNPVPLYLHLNLDAITIPREISHDRLMPHPARSWKIGGVEKAYAGQQNLASVGFHTTRQACQPDPSDLLDKECVRVIRVHDTDQLAKYFDCETGEFFPPSHLNTIEKNEADR